MMKKTAALVLALIICFSLISPAASAAARDLSLEQELASDLKSLSLFKGVSDTDFDLGRAPTRTEAVVMLIRVLGKESAALGSAWSHPFTDVAPWAANYVGYAYQNGLTKGISDTQFGTGTASAAMYLTFVLRALGYSDTGGADFTWDNPFTLAGNLKILPGKVSISEFWRSDVVLVSYSALPVKIKGGAQTLAEKLMADKVFTKAQYDAYYDANAISSYVNKTPLSAEEIYAKCSPAVFYIEVYDSYGNATASGSGFFIDSSGTAVTNYHVIKGCSSAKIMVSDTEKVYNVAGVYDYDKAEDWAVLKIEGSGFSYLKTGDASSVVGGATVYAIGSPLGLQNTITQGLISNPKRMDAGISYIQTSAAISSGSSGGALINKYGDVIGITSASYIDGQNLNLALPMSYLSAMDLSSVRSLADVTGAPSTPSTPIEISISVDSLEIKKGASSTIYVKWTGGSDDDNIYWDTSNKNVATAAWGNWVTDEILALTIYGNSLGTAIISVYVDSRHTYEIAVTVSSSNPYEVLKKNLQLKGQYMDNGYVLTDSINDDTFYLIYRPYEQYQLCLMSDTYINGTYISTIVFIYEGSIAYYDVLISYPPLSGYDVFIKDSFNSGTRLLPAWYEGPANTKVDFGGLCAVKIAELLAETEYILRINGIPVTVGDFGFNTMYQELICDWILSD